MQLNTEVVKITTKLQDVVSVKDNVNKTMDPPEGHGDIQAAGDARGIHSRQSKHSTISGDANELIQADYTPIGMGRTEKSIELGSCC